jgi:hypothetical protein
VVEEIPKQEILSEIDKTMPVKEEEKSNKQEQEMIEVHQNQ